jgi:hypothetical protein
VLTAERGTGMYCGAISFTPDKNLSVFPFSKSKNVIFCKAVIVVQKLMTVMRESLSRMARTNAPLCGSCLLYVSR